MAGRRVRILLVEDSVSDAELVLHELRRAGIDPDWVRVDHEAAFRAQLNPGIELILADYNMPQFDALKALAILKSSGLDIPFIIVSGGIGDKVAVESMRGGAVDYVFKDNLSRLAAAAIRELEAADQRKSSTRARDESQARLSAVMISALDAVVTVDAEGRIVEWNPAAAILFGWSRDEVVGRELADLIFPPEGRSSHLGLLARFRQNPDSIALSQRLELDLLRRNGDLFPAEEAIWQLKVGDEWFFSAFIRDITDRKQAEKTTSAHLAVSLALSEAGSLERVLAKVLDGIGSRLGWDIGQVWLRDPADGLLHCAHQWLRDGATDSEFSAANRAARFELGDGVVGQVWLDRQPLWLEDLGQAKEFRLGAAALRSGVTSAVFTPLFAGTELNGVVQFFSQKRRSVDPSLLQLMADLSGRFGEFIRRTQTEAALHESEARFRGLFYDVAVGQALIGMPDGKVLAINRAFCRLLGYRSEDLLGKSADVFADTEHGEAVRQAFHLLSPDLPYYHLESRLKRKNSGTIWASVGVSATFGDGDRPKHLLMQVQDISKRKEAEGALGKAQEELVHRGRHDALTELPNRIQLQERMYVAIATAQPLAVLALNLDHFKEVNNSFGYLAGDDLLKQLAPRIRECVRQDDLIARLGGDGFAILLVGADQQTASRIAENVNTALEQPFVIDGHPLAVGASIGVVSYPQDGDDAEVLLRRADIALHVAKRSRGSVAVFRPEYEDQGASHLALMAELRTAIHENRLAMYYQPLIDIKRGTAIRFEALLRWNHPTRGMLPPDQFIPFAEQTGVIQPLTDWVLRTVLRQSDEWQEAGQNVSVAVNISMRNLLDEGLPERIGAMLKARPEAGHEAKRPLTLEVTESVLMAEPERAIERLERLRRLGIRLSVDDFGTGYSSLAYLSRLPVNEMKIDRSFITGIAHDPSKAAIVRAALDLGHNLRLEVVAEGVEDQLTWDLLSALGCDTAQGFHMGRPMPADAIIPWLLNSPYGGIASPQAA